MPSAKEQIADHLANRRVRWLIACSAGQPGAQRVRRVRLDADRQGDGRVQVQRGPDSRQRGDQPEPGLLRDADPAGPHLRRGRGGEDQQRPGPDGPGTGRRPRRTGPPAAGPGRGRTTGPRSAAGAGRGGAGAVHAGGEQRPWRSPPFLRGERVGFAGQCGQGGGYLVGGGADVGRVSRPCRCRCRCGLRRPWRRRSRSSARPRSGWCAFSPHSPCAEDLCSDSAWPVRLRDFRADRDASCGDSRPCM